MKCPRCKGEGRIDDYQLTKNKREDIIESGEGDGKMPCPTCEGDGWLTEQQEEELKKEGYLKGGKNEM